VCLDFSWPNDKLLELATEPEMSANETWRAEVPFHSSSAGIKACLSRRPEEEGEREKEAAGETGGEEAAIGVGGREMGASEEPRVCQRAECLCKLYNLLSGRQRGRSMGASCNTCHCKGHPVLPKAGVVGAACFVYVAQLASLSLLQSPTCLLLFGAAAGIAVGATIKQTLVAGATGGIKSLA